MDPLSVSASVTGLIMAGSQIASLIQRLYDAPSIALAVETETSHFVVVLSQLQPFLTGQRTTIAHPSRTSLVEVQQIQIILTGSVLTLSELQAAVGAICHGSTSISLRDRIKWVMAESNIAQLIQRVRDHKSSLTLLLTLLTWYDRVSSPLTPPPRLPNADVDGSKSTSEATNNMTQLCALLEQFIEHNTQLFARVQELEGEPLAPEPRPSAKPGIRTSSVSFHGTFERVLSESDLYRRVLNRGNPNARSGHANFDNRSIASRLSLSQAPDISTMRLAVSPAELSNPECYGTMQTQTAEFGNPQQSGSDGFLVQPTDIRYRPSNEWDQTAWELMQSGADKEAVNPGGYPSIQFSSNYTYVRGLHTACKQGDHNNALLCLERGADCASVNWNGEYPLHVAARHGHFETVMVLLEWGADTAVCNQFLESPLHHAAMNGHYQTVRVLLQYHAKPDPRNRWGETPLYLAAVGGYLQAVSALLEAGAEVEEKRDMRTLPSFIAGNYPLHIAASNGHSGVVALLLRSGAGKETENRSGATPLQCAVAWAKYATVLELVEFGAEIEAKTHGGSCALHFAARNSNCDITVLLLNSGANIEAEDESGQRPLHVAVQAKQKAMVSLLLKWGAQWDAMDGSGDTPLGLARASGDGEILQTFTDA